MEPSESPARSTRPAQPVVFVGESEGQPMLVQLDVSFGAGYSDKSRPMAVMIEVRLLSVDSNGLPPQADWPELERVEAALVREFAETEDDWRYVARTYGGGAARYCFYGRKTSTAASRSASVLAGLTPTAHLGPHTVSVQSDPTWSAYNGFFPPDQTPKDSGPAPSFRDAPPYHLGRRNVTPRDDQPWRGEESQSHPDD